MSKDHSTEFEDIAGEIFSLGKPFTITADSVREALLKIRNLPSEKYTFLPMHDMLRMHYGSKVFEEEILPVLLVKEDVLRQGLTGNFEVKNG